MVSGRYFFFNHCLTEWKSFHSMHGLNRYTSRRKRVLNIGAMCEFGQNEDTFSVYFEELDHYFTKNGQKEHTCGISKRHIQVMLQEIAPVFKFV